MNLTGLIPSKIYYYRIYANNLIGNSTMTAIVNATMTAIVNATTSAAIFTQVRTSIFPKCLNCHDAAHASSAKGSDLSNYAGVMTGVVPNNISSSILCTKTADSSMPIGGTKLTSAELNSLISWINSGAPNN